MKNRTYLMIFQLQVIAEFCRILLENMHVCKILKSELLKQNRNITFNIERFDTNIFLTNIRYMRIM